MNFTEFMSILNGEYKETAGTVAKNQCVDLANAYIRYVLGLPIIEWTNAKDFPFAFEVIDNYDYILNTPTGVPKEGDLVIWGGNQYGHIAIFIEGNADRFTSFDENYPTGSPCHVQEHSYSNVLGWLHPNHAIITQPIAQPIITDQTIIDLGQFGKHEVQAIRGFYAEAETWKVDLENTRLELAKVNQDNAGLIAQNKDLARQLNECLVKPPQGPNIVSYSWSGLIDYLGHLIKRL